MVILPEIGAAGRIIKKKKGKCPIARQEQISKSHIFLCQQQKYRTEISDDRFGKSTHISMISNSVSHLRSYANSGKIGMYLHARTFCRLSHTTSIPVGAMYLHARTFCTLAHMTSKPVGAMYLHARTFCTLAHMTSKPVGGMYLRTRRF